MSMIFNLFRKSPAPDAAFEAYRSIVAQSRQVKFYADWGVPDTVTGRFDMISLHLALVLRRLKGQPELRPFGQALVDLFFRDMDRSLRELGVTDLGVPKKVKTMGNLFYGLVEALTEALDSGEPGKVELVLDRNIYGATSSHAASLAHYLVEEAARLAAQPAEAIAAGQLGAAA
jgi:cytochrome b pre-mRNA-processing protein 3